LIYVSNIGGLWNSLFVELTVEPAGLIELIYWLTDSVLKNEKFMVSHTNP
jgi:hypothetical protein